MHLFRCKQGWKDSWKGTVLKKKKKKIKWEKSFHISYTKTGSSTVQQLERVFKKLVKVLTEHTRQTLSASDT